ncbi:MAG TPA: helix-turn-helix domain-containing protein [Aestuariivirgaceae bacterium]|nr:helix-turn-helix domain-containing protein [Aestuariivirgaceae bacterium]
MDSQFSTAVTPARPVPPLQAATAMPRARLAPGDAQAACDIAGAVVATVLWGSRPQAAPPARAAAFGRQIAMYLAHVVFGLSMAEVGRAFERDRTTVVHACHLIEDRRDEMRFDQLLDHLEQAAIALCTASSINRQV